jgi:hypothetical protein
LDLPFLLFEVKPVPRTTSLLLALCALLPATVVHADAPSAAPEPVTRKIEGAAQTPTICDGSAALTLIGLDTTSGRMLFSVPPLSAKDRPWIVELDARATAARAYPDPPQGLYSGSVGPGPVVAAVPCGSGCLQPMRWEGGTWAPLGESLTTPTAANLSVTYDPNGTPWLLLQGPTAQDGLIKVWAYHLEGREWTSHGTMEVTAVGQPSSLPAPQRKDGVLSGTGLFSASGHPEAWVAGLPDLPAARRGEIVSLTGTDAAYLSSDGVAYLSEDGGKKWRRSTWTPWGSTGVVGSWRQGTDYWVDQPFGDHQGALRLVWFDRRSPSEEHVLLTELRRSGWVRLADAGSEVRTKSGDSMPVTQVLVPKGSDWILLSGCANTANGSGLVLRVFDGKEVSPARFVPFTVGSGG